MPNNQKQNRKKQKQKQKLLPAEELIRQIICHIGEDPDREGLRDTPKRVVKSWTEIFGGYKEDIEKLLRVSFSVEYSGMIIADTIRFHSTCEHHWLPFMGVAHVAYIPANNKVVGYSKIPRTVRAYARRLQVQERLTREIAEAIEEHVKPLGVAVVMEASHHCARCRGVTDPTSVMQTAELRGVFLNDSATRAEFSSRLPRRNAAAI